MSLQVNGKCIRESIYKIDKLDGLVIEDTNLDLKYIYNVFEAFNTINKKLSFEHIVSICSRCSWKNKCLFYIEKTKIWTLFLIILFITPKMKH